MTPHLYVVRDDLFFAERVRTTSKRLGLDLVFLSPEEAAERDWEADSVVTLQATLHPDRQLALVERLRRADPAPRVIVVTGHLETELRARAKAAGAVLAAHSGMERVFARACGINGDGAGADPLR